MKIFRHTLPNGIRLVHAGTNGIVGHCGLIINTGSGNETEKEHGIAHLIEHLLFKGTSKRKAYHILSRLDDVGGELNAYTTKEETAIHASFLNQHYERAMELIGDIVFSSVFPSKEIEKEKEVIAEEINSYRDNPGEMIFDEFEEVIFKDQPIGRNILGKPETIRALTRENIMSFIERNYNTDNIVFCSAGNIEESKLLKLFEKYFSGYPKKKTAVVKPQNWHYKPEYMVKDLDTWQCHCIIGNIAYNVRDEKRINMFLLNNILGGMALNSRLNMSLREKKGYAYNVESNYNPYYNTGIFSVYFGTDSQNLEKSIDLTHLELKKMSTEKLGTSQLDKAKNQMKGYLARGYENHESLMLSLGKSILVFDRIESIEEHYRKIDNITSSGILETAAEILDIRKMSTLIYK